MRQGIRLWMTIALLLCAGCNLSKTEVAALPTTAPVATEEETPRATRTPIAFGNVAVNPNGGNTLPTLLPLPGVPNITTIATAQPTLIPVTSVPVFGTACQIYTTYSGVVPQNTLSLRMSASTTAPQVFRVPTNAQVLLVPTALETEADGYHWLNVVYVAPTQIRYRGWMARDSFATNGVRDPSIATLRPTGSQAAC